MGTCGTCLKGTLHIRCNEICEKKLVCGHYCDQACSYECICLEKCGNKCGHTNCKNKCYEECSIGTYNDNFKCKDCHGNCKECDGPYTPENNNCITCISDEKFLNYGNCISYCPRDYYINRTNNQNTCKCELEQCQTCSIESINLNLCTRRSFSFFLNEL